MDAKPSNKEDLKMYLCNSIDSLGLDETAKVLSELLLSIAHSEGQDVEINMNGIGSVKVSLDRVSQRLNS